MKKMEEELRIESDNVLIGSDFHIPFHSNFYLHLLLSYAREHNVKTLICPGDFLDCFVVSRFINYQYGGLTFEEELRSAGEVMKELTDTFTHIYFTRGNHESFWLTKLEGYNNIHDLFKLFTTGIAKEGTDYTVTNYDHLILNDNWYICHPINYSRIPLSIPRKLATKLQMNICCAHEHRLGICKDESGKYYTIETGGIFDPTKIEYLKSSTTFPAQVQGFIYLKDDDPYLIF